jgi:hypothetical protein
MSQQYDGDINLVESWLRVDPLRWISGVITGALAGGIALVVAMAIAVSSGYEIWFPAKLMATILLDSHATEYGMNPLPILAGVALIEAISIFWGVIYSHFTFTNKFIGLFGMGLTWGIFLWIFNWCLYLQSFHTIRAAAIPPSAAFPVCIAYGLSLTLLGVIYPVLSGGRQRSAA